MRTGQYAYSSTDLAFGSGADLKLVRQSGSYDHGVHKPFGNFSHNWFIYLAIHSDGTTSAPSYLLSVEAGGRSQSFTSSLLSGSTTYASSGSYASLQLVSQTGVDAIYTADDGTVIYFRPFSGGDCHVTLSFKCSFASQMVEPDGTTYTLTYDTASSPDGNTARLRRVTSNRGYQLIFEYGSVSSRQDLISKACLIDTAQTIPPASPVCPSGSKAASYTYNSTNYFMASMTDPASSVYTFTSDFPSFPYSGSLPIIYHVSYYRPGLSSPYLTNTRRYESSMVDLVTDQAFQDGTSISYTWNEFYTGETDYQIIGGSYSVSGNPSVTVGFGSLFRPDKRWAFTSGPTTITDELGHTTSGNYCLTYLGKCILYPVRQWTYPEGNSVAFEYDAHNNITTRTDNPKSGSGQTSTVTQWTYGPTSPSLWNKPTSETDPKGNVTNWAYTSFGELASEMKPAPVANGARPLKLVTYVQKSAYIKNSSGTLVSTGQPIWVLSTEIECQTVAGSNPAATCDSSAPQKVTTYEYGANGTADNLLVHGIAVTADGQTRRTCYGYDEFSQRISETGPRAGLTSCP